MQEIVGFRVGVNLGGWLSQYQVYDHEHFKTFISEHDIEQIASWGADHVRLPIDYQILEDDEEPFEYKASGFEYIDRCLEWCQANGLSVVLDLHHAPGYTFDAISENSLFASESLQQRFVSLWKALAEYYAGRKEPDLIFELLNEVVLPSSEPWNNLAHRAHGEIRLIDSNRWILVGGNQWNAARTLKEIELFDDPRVSYTFHFYEPLPFTHQKAYWVEALKAYNTELAYPGDIPGLQEALAGRPQYYELMTRYMDCRMDKKFLRDELKPALEFQRQTGVQLYCGEFGVINQAPADSTLRWYRDFLDLLRESKIGYACWSYKRMDFGLVDREGRIVDTELLNIIFPG